MTIDLQTPEGRAEARKLCAPMTMEEARLHKDVLSAFWQRAALLPAALDEIDRLTKIIEDERNTFAGDPT